MKSALRFVALLAGTAATATATPAFAASLIGLADGATLVMIDVDAKRAGKSVQVSGVSDLVGIDVRPADGMLYGVAADGRVFTIDLASGRASEKSKLKTMLPAGAVATIDFNPAADRLRLIGSDGTNLRANVDDGSVTTDGPLKFADGDAHKGQMPRVVAGAYTNSHKGAKGTMLYDIDAATGTLVRQAPPNDGVLNAVGKIDVAVSGPVGFDILSDAQGGNRAWLFASGALHEIDLATGQVRNVGRIEGLPGDLRDIAVLSAM